MVSPLLHLHRVLALLMYEWDGTYSDFGFVNKNGTCIPSSPISMSPTNCKSRNPEEKFEGPSGYRKIAGNTCEGGIDKTKKIPRACGDGECFGVFGEVWSYIYVPSLAFNEPSTLNRVSSPSTFGQVVLQDLVL